MSDPKPPAAAETAPTPKLPDVKPEAKPTKPLRPPNPIYKYMGLGENFRPRLPSRNWSIFLTITGSFTAAVIYDKREKRRVQRKWCRLVEHVAKDTLGPKEMPRKLTVFLEAPPTDGLRASQEHFKEYVKPILVASGLDWEFIQGRKEGDVRAELAEKIRHFRTSPEQRTKEDPVSEIRKRMGVVEFDGIKGDIIIGRHTWKEYVRGLHEGWLGPISEPPKPAQEKLAEEAQSEKEAEAPMETVSGVTITSTPRDAEANPETPKSESEKSKKPPQPPPFISASEYASAPTPPELPAEFDPSTLVSFPHILGFLNTPKRIYRFLNRRALADSIGRETASVILAHARQYHNTSASRSSPSSFSTDENNPAQRLNPSQDAEQQTALIWEEKEWHKNALKRVEGEPERTWLEPIVLDPRIASRMRRFELTHEDEARAKTIVVPEVEVEGWIKGGIRSLGRQGLGCLGFGKKEVKHEYKEEEEEEMT